MNRNSCAGNKVPRLLVLVALILGGHELQAATIALRPVADTTLIETAPDNNLGGQPFFNSGTTQIHTRNRGLIRFDVSSSVPRGSLIESAQLTLEVTGEPADGFAEGVFGLHPMLTPWGEGVQTTSDPNTPGLGGAAETGEASWNSPAAQSGATWGAPGGLAGVDFTANASAVLNVFGVNRSPYHFNSNPELVADVQFWLDNPERNHGWMLLQQDEAVPFTARRFGSHEDNLNHPVLTIQFAPVPEPAIVALMGIGLLFRRRMRRSNT